MIAEYKCQICSRYEERYYAHYESAPDIVECTECRNIMVRIPSVASFQVRGHSSRNNYNANPQGISSPDTGGGT